MPSVLAKVFDSSNTEYVIDSRTSIDRQPENLDATYLPDFPAGEDTAAPEVHSFQGMPAVIHSPAMRKTLALIKKAATTSAVVLITGESGSGKEVAARALHDYSQRATRPWIDVNCGALPDELAESELFGYDRGAFSGANTHKPGFFELADGGTLFLDEIGELNPKLQVKLLRILDGVPYYRLGSTRKTTVNVRIVAATNRPLEQAVAEGRFRSDLFHRLNQVRIPIPPLRERVEDIEPLAKFLLEKSGLSCVISPAALRALKRYSWPGNIRELRNVLITAAMNSDNSDRIDIGDLPPHVRGAEPEARMSVPAPAQSDTMVEVEAKDLRLPELERRAIMKALAETGGRQDRAASLLGISRRTLIRRLKEYEHGFAERFIMTTQEFQAVPGNGELA